MQNTTNFNLKKPDYTDPVDIQDINDNMDTVDAALQARVLKTVQVVAGNGLTGGGALDSNKTLTLGTPTTVTNTTTNSVTTTGHTHALTLTKADITGLGIPGEDTNTTYTAGAGLTLTGTVFTPTFGTGINQIPHGNDPRFSDSRTPKAHNQDWSTITGQPTIPTDTNQLTNGAGFVTVDTTYTAGTNVAISGTNVISATDTKYTHPTTAGNLHIPTGGAVGQILRNTASGTATWQNETDTITTINGKTGAISKADIVALGIPSSDTNTTYTAGAGLTLTGTVFTPAFGTTAGTVTQGNDSRLSNARVPLAHNHTRTDVTDLGSVAGINTNASTDNYLRGDGTWVTPPNTNTTYSAMSVVEGTTGTATSSRTVRADYLKQIIQGYIPSSLPANGGNASTVGGFTVGVSVPANAKFTDTNTITTINGKTGTITKADIVALGIPEQDTNTVYTHPTTAGNKHIPTGGTVGQILKNTASGTATWQNENAAGVTSVTAGNGLNFTSISSTGAVTLGTPSTITYSTTNNVSSTSHTHALTLTKANITGLGIPAQDTVYTHPSTHPASIISLASTNFTATNVEAGMVELFQNVNDGKTAVAGAIAAKGVAASSADTFPTLATKIGQITTQSVLSGNATVSQVLSGRTFYSNNPSSRLTGTMVNRGAVTNTLTTQGGSYTIPSGYHSGAGKVTASFANLVAGNVKSGVNIGGVVGSLATPDFMVNVDIDKIITKTSGWSYIEHHESLGFVVPSSLKKLIFVGRMYTEGYPNASDRTGSNFRFGISNHSQSVGEKRLLTNNIFANVVTDWSFSSVKNLRVSTWMYDNTYQSKQVSDGASWNDTLESLISNKTLYMFLTLYDAPAQRRVVCKGTFIGFY